MLPDGGWRSRPSLLRLADALGAGEGQVRIVGGAVRDTLLGLPVADVDLATVFPPEEAARRIAAAGIKVVPTGLAHGTVTAVLPEGPVEVTTLRRDVATDGRHAIVAFTDDWHADAVRRDFTINALYADPLTGAVEDYVGGLADLRDRHIRFIGDPLRRIAEDHLRILRFFRFHARFGQGAPDAAALAACTARRNDLMALSRERIAQELLKLLAVPDPVPTIAVMLAHGILAPVLPEITDADRLAALVPREALHGADPIRRLAALLPSDPSVAEVVGARLKLSNAQRRRLVSAAEAGEPPAARAIAYRIGIDHARDRILLHAADPAPALASLAGWSPPSLPINGGALIEMGLAPGPIVAESLAQVADAWIAAGFPDREATYAIARRVVTAALRSS